MIDDEHTPRASVPADIGAPDTIAWGLTFRQLAIAGGVAAGCWLIYRQFGPLLPPAVWLAALLPVTAVTAVVVLGRRDGLPLDVWLRHGLTLARTPRRQTPGAADAGPLLLEEAGPLRAPAPLRRQQVTIAADGTLTVAGAARRVITCATTNVALRTGTEQQALLAGFGAWLNALTQPAQIVVAAHRDDLAAHADTVVDRAARLPSAALQAAAADYAAFLHELDRDREPLRRQVLAVVAAGPAVEVTVRAFTALGAPGAALDGGAATAALAAAADPFDSPAPGTKAVPGVPVTLRRT